jgi:predicted metal-dependent phosphoesterase TrpH
VPLALADLHTHTSASDGTLTPSELIDAAASQGIRVIAVSDHDSVEGVAPALEAASRAGVTVVPAVELSALHEDQDVHVLGYFIDHADTALTERLLEFRRGRLQRAVAMIEALDDAGYAVSIDDVLAHAGEGAVGRSHVARALVDRGSAASVSEAFTDLIGRDRPFFRRKPLLEPSEVISVIHDAGGLAVLAHPGVGGAEDLIADLVDAGLDGLEAFHPEHTEEDAVRIERIASDAGLLVTGGSDYHGPGHPGPGLGAVGTPRAHLDRLFEAAGRD